jgi:membrane-associated phospholipid phosphatase
VYLVYIIGKIFLSIFYWVIEKDQQLFLLINQKLNNSFFDSLLPFCRDAKNWIPLYVFVIYLAIKEYKRKAWIWILFAVLTVCLTDQISASIIKPLVHRPRPYLDEHFYSQVRLLLSNINRGFSFVSSHATNHFGIAIFFVQTINILKKYRWLLYTWAAVICYAQIYVGVHYPIDVFCGALLGILIGFSTAKGFKKLTHIG